MKLLQGKVAVITGAARGIGKAIAIKFANEGADIAFTDLAIDAVSYTHLDVYKRQVLIVTENE